MVFLTTREIMSNYLIPSRTSVALLEVEWIPLDNLLAIYEKHKVSDTRFINRNNYENFIKDMEELFFKIKQQKNKEVTK